MEDSFMVKINEKDVLAQKITCFHFLYNDYCIFAVENEENEMDIYCERIIRNTLQEINDDQEKNLINKIVKELLNPKEEKDCVILTEENGKELEVEVLDILKVNEEEYIIYSLPYDEKQNEIAIRKIKESKEEFATYSIEEEEEKNLIFNIVQSIIE